MRRRKFTYDGSLPRRFITSIALASAMASNTKVSRWVYRGLGAVATPTAILIARRMSAFTHASLSASTFSLGCATLAASVSTSLPPSPIQQVALFRGTPRAPKLVGKLPTVEQRPNGLHSRSPLHIIVLKGDFVNCRHPHIDQLRQSVHLVVVRPGRECLQFFDKIFLPHRGEAQVVVQDIDKSPRHHSRCERRAYRLAGIRRHRADRMV